MEDSSDFPGCFWLLRCPVDRSEMEKIDLRAVRAVRGAS